MPYFERFRLFFPLVGVGCNGRLTHIFAETFFWDVAERRFSR